MTFSSYFKEHPLPNETHYAGGLYHYVVVYVRALREVSRQVQIIPGQQVCWLPIFHCDGLDDIKPGNIGRVGIPGWIIREKKLILQEEEIC